MTRRNLRGLLPALLIAGATTGTASGQQAFVNYLSDGHSPGAGRGRWGLPVEIELADSVTESVTREPPTRRRPCAGIWNSVGERP